MDILRRQWGALWRLVKASVSESQAAFPTIEKGEGAYETMATCRALTTLPGEEARSRWINEGALLTILFEMGWFVFMVRMSRGSNPTADSQQGGQQASGRGCLTLGAQYGIGGEDKDDGMDKDKTLEEDWRS